MSQGAGFHREGRFVVDPFVCYAEGVQKVVDADFLFQTALAVRRPAFFKREFHMSSLSLYDFLEV